MPSGGMHCLLGACRDTYVDTMEYERCVALDSGFITVNPEARVCQAECR